jgi:glycosyltransferase involved in cell wall biosynthesis
MALKVVVFGSHPHITNGYSKVVYHLAREMAVRQHLQLVVFGFQRFHDNAPHEARRVLPSNVKVHDAWANEEPRHQGFGFAQARGFVEAEAPDVVVVYNDFVVISQILEQLTGCSNRADFRVVVYLDQVYTFHRPAFVEMLNRNTDMVLTFSPHWTKVLQRHALRVPQVLDLPHGFCRDTYYPVPQDLARSYFGLAPDDFVILNLNRNQPRKRWDLCMMAMAEVVARDPSRKIRLFIGTTVSQGAWHLVEVFENELRKRGLALSDGLPHLVGLDRPQALSDFEVNCLYNAADVGINTAMGEGWGLCNFEQAAIGKPQIVPRLGAFVDYLDDDCSTLIEPIMSLYADFSYDSVGGETSLCDPSDFAKAIERYYSDRDLLRLHGQRARQRLGSPDSSYVWHRVADKFEEALWTVSGKTKPVVVEPPELPAAAPEPLPEPSSKATEVHLVPERPRRATAMLQKKLRELRAARSRTR